MGERGTYLRGKDLRGGRGEKILVGGGEGGKRF